MFLRESLTLVAAGVLPGLPLALALARFAPRLLFRGSASDPLGIGHTRAAHAGRFGRRLRAGPPRNADRSHAGATASPIASAIRTAGPAGALSDDPVLR